MLLLFVRFVFQLYLINNTSRWISFNCFIRCVLFLFSWDFLVFDIYGIVWCFIFRLWSVRIVHFIGAQIQNECRSRLLRRRTRHTATIKRFIVFDNCTLKVFEFVLLCVYVCMCVGGEILSKACAPYTLSHVHKSFSAIELRIGSSGKIDYAKNCGAIATKKKKTERKTHTLWKWIKRKETFYMFRPIWFHRSVFFFFLSLIFSINVCKVVRRCVAAISAHSNKNSKAWKSWVVSILKVHKRAFARLIGCCCCCCYCFFCSRSFHLIWQSRTEISFHHLESSLAVKKRWLNSVHFWWLYDVNIHCMCLVWFLLYKTRFDWWNHHLIWTLEIC